MSVLPILCWPDAHLSQRCAPVKEDVGALARDMLDTMYAAPGRGLAAPQVGVLVRLFVMDVGWKDGARDPGVFVNPEIVDASEACVSRSEGCLSIPGVDVGVMRPEQVEMAWQDLDGRAHRKLFDGFAAACVQHEIDHLDGIVTFDRMSPEARAALEAQYRGCI